MSRLRDMKRKGLRESEIWDLGSFGFWPKIGQIFRLRRSVSALKITKNPQKKRVNLYSEGGIAPQARKF